MTIVWSSQNHRTIIDKHTKDEDALDHEERAAQIISVARTITFLHPYIITVQKL
jgi:hypothetical protein